MIVIGGGIAGLAASVRLCSMGLLPILLEKRPFLGGRAFSFRYDSTGEEVDNGQHVIVGACREYLSFLDIIGASSNLTMQQSMNIPVIGAKRTVNLKAASLPGSLANLAALARYSHLSFYDRLRVLLGLVRIRFMKDEASRTLDGVTFYDWLMQHGQNENTLKYFWNLVALPTFNDDIHDVSASAGVMLFKTAVLSDPENAALGYSRVGLSELTGKNARMFIESHGGKIHTREAVVSVKFHRKEAASVTTTTGTVITGDCIISALPASSVMELFQDYTEEERFFQSVGYIRCAPIVSIHIWYDKPVMDCPFVATVDSIAQWVFNVSMMHNDPTRYHIAISLSAAWRWKDMPKNSLKTLFSEEMRRLFPKAAKAKVEHILIVKTPEATFRMLPGAEQFRLPHLTPIPGLFLAGDWTKTGWPSTMESAVISGNLAADNAAQWLTGRRQSG